MPCVETFIPDHPLGVLCRYSAKQLSEMPFGEASHLRAIGTFSRMRMYRLTENGKHYPLKTIDDLRAYVFREGENAS